MKKQIEHAYDDSDLSDEAWMRWVTYLVFLNDDEEDIYTTEDSKPLYTKLKMS